MVIVFMNTKELLENQMLVINSKRLSNVIKKVRYNLDIMGQTAYLVVNPITFYSYGFLFSWTTVDKAQSH